MPNYQTVHIDRALTSISTAYIQDESVFIADKIFPKIPVTKQSDIYFAYDKADLYRDEAQERGQATESVGSDYGVEAQDPYYCRTVTLHKDVTEQERLNYDAPLNADRDAVEFISQKMLINREVKFADKFLKAGVWGRDITGIAYDEATPPEDDEFIKWSDPASDPITDISNEVVKMAGETGFKPNTLVLAPDVFFVLKNHEMILDRIKYTQKGVLTESLLASLFEIENVYIPWAVANSAKKGAAENTGFIFGGCACLLYVNPRPALKKPSAGYIFTWTGLEGSSAYGTRILRIPMPLKGVGTERIEAEASYDQKVICKDMGTFFSDVI